MQLLWFLFHFCERHPVTLPPQLLCALLRKALLGNGSKKLAGNIRVTLHFHPRRSATISIKLRNAQSLASRERGEYSAKASAAIFNDCVCTRSCYM